jgi:hypothetical protein
MREAEHVPAIRRIASILDRMNDPASPLRTMLSADAEHPPLVPPALDLSRWDRSLVQERVERGVVERVRSRVYLPLPDGGARAYEESILAEVRGLVNGTRAPFWFSHATAALLHGAWSYNTPMLVHLTQPTNPHVARDDEPMVRRHHTALPPSDRTDVDGVPVTSLERTLVDCIRTLPRASAVVACDSLFRLGADPWAVSRIVSESRGKRGVVQARQVLDLSDPRAASPGEVVTRLVAIDAGLPRPECQVEVSTAVGTFFVDLGWEHVRVAVEFDGEVKYSGGEYGRPDVVRRAEAERQRALEAAGWIVIRVRWADLDDPIALERRIRDAYYAAIGRRRLVLTA